jgi:hypothetical protein
MDNKEKELDLILSSTFQETHLRQEANPKLINIASGGGYSDWFPVLLKSKTKNLKNYLLSPISHLPSILRFTANPLRQNVKLARLFPSGSQLF